MKLPIYLLLGFALVAPVAAQEGDPVAGKKVFAKCSSCHDISAEPRNRMGPYLTGVVGRAAASVEGFTYSKPMNAARDGGLVWTPETLSAFIAAPHDYVPGTKMPNVAVADEKARGDLIAYLVSLSPEFDPATQTSTYAPPNGAADPAQQAPAQ